MIVLEKKTNKTLYMLPVTNPQIIFLVEWGDDMNF